MLYALTYGSNRACAAVVGHPPYFTNIEAEAGAGHLQIRTDTICIHGCCGRSSRNSELAQCDESAIGGLDVPLKLALGTDLAFDVWELVDSFVVYRMTGVN